MFNKQIITSFLVLIFIAIGCKSPSSLTSDELTNVSGVVLSEQTFERVSGAEIQFSEEGRTVTTDANGTFILREVGVGTHTVVISADGYGTVEKSVEIVNGGTRLQLMIK